MGDDFSANVKQFIDQNIESLAQLEALLLMRQDPASSWDATSISKALYIPPEMAEALLVEFTRRGYTQSLTASPPRYAYAPSDEKLARLLDDVAGAYQDRRVAIISLIYSKPLNKVQTFADAFRLRKEPPQ